VWNLDQETGYVDGGLAYFSQNQFYVKGDRIAKTGDKEFDCSRDSSPVAIPRIRTGRFGTNT